MMMMLNAMSSVPSIQSRGTQTRSGSTPINRVNEERFNTLKGPIYKAQKAMMWPSIAGTMLMDYQPKMVEALKKLTGKDFSKEISSTLSIPGALAYGLPSILSAATKTLRLPAEKQYAKQLGMAGTTSRALDSLSMIRHLGRTAPVFAAMMASPNLGNMARKIIPRPENLLTAPALGAYGATKGIVKGAGRAADWLSGGAISSGINAVKGTQIGGAAAGVLKKAIGGANAQITSNILGDPMGLSLTLAGIQMAAAVWKGIKLQKIRPTRKAASTLERKYSVSSGFTQALGQVQNTMMTGKTPPEQIIAQLAMIQSQLLIAIEQHVSPIGEIYAELDMIRQEKEKGTTSFGKEYGESILGDEKKSFSQKLMDKVEGSLTHAMTKYNPLTQLASTVVGLLKGKIILPKAEQDRIAKTYGFDNYEKMTKEQSSEFGISIPLMRLLQSDSKKIIQMAPTFEAQQIALLSAIFDIQRLTAQETMTMRKGMGFDDNLFYSGPEREGLMYSFREMVRKLNPMNLPGVNALVNLAKLPFKIPGLIRKGAMGAYKGAKNFIFGSEYQELAEGGLAKKVGATKSTQDRAYEFLSEGLPDQLERLRDVGLAQLDMLQNILATNMLILQAQGLNYTYKKTQDWGKEHIREWNYVAGKYHSKTGREDWKNQLFKESQFEMETAFRHGPFGQLLQMFGMGGRVKKERNAWTRKFGSWEQEHFGARTTQGLGDILQDLIGDIAGVRTSESEKFFSTGQAKEKRQFDESFLRRLKKGLKWWKPFSQERQEVRARQKEIGSLIGPRGKVSGRESAFEQEQILRGNLEQLLEHVAAKGFETNQFEQGITSQFNLHQVQDDMLGALKAIRDILQSSVSVNVSEIGGIDLVGKIPTNGSPQLPVFAHIDLTDLVPAYSDLPLTDSGFIKVAMMEEGGQKLQSKTPFVDVNIAAIAEELESPPVVQYDQMHLPMNEKQWTNLQKQARGGRTGFGPILVGEKGPELFVPAAAEGLAIPGTGTILPNDITSYLASMDEHLKKICGFDSGLYELQKELQEETLHEKIDNIEKQKKEEKKDKLQYDIWDRLNNMYKIMKSDEKRKSLLDKLKGSGSDIWDFIKGLGSMIPSFLSNIGSLAAIAGTIYLLYKILKKVGPMLKRFDDWLSESGVSVKQRIAGYLQTASTTGIGLGHYAMVKTRQLAAVEEAAKAAHEAALPKATKSPGIFSKGLDWVKGKLGGIGGKAATAGEWNMGMAAEAQFAEQAGIAGKAGKAGEFFSKGAAFLEKIFKPLMPIFEGVLKGLEPIGKMLLKVGRVLGKLATPVAIVTTIWDFVSDTISGWKEGGFAGAIRGFFVGKMKDDLETGLGQVGKWAGFGAMVGTPIAPILGTIVGALIGAGIGALITGIKGIFIDSEKKGIGTAIFDNLFSKDGGLLAGIKGAGLWAGIGAAAGTAIVPGLGTIVGALVGGAVGGIINYFGTVKIENAKEFMANLGVNKWIIDGLAEGSYARKFAEWGSFVPLIGPIVGGVLGITVDMFVEIFKGAKKLVGFAKDFLKKYFPFLFPDEATTAATEKAYAESGAEGVSLIGGSTAPNITSIAAEGKATNQGLLNLTKPSAPGPKLPAPSTQTTAGTAGTTPPSTQTADGTKPSDSQLKQNVQMGTPGKNVKELIQQASGKTGAPADTMLKIADAESSFRPWATNPEGTDASRSGAQKGGATSAGLFQFTMDTWNNSINRWGSRYGILPGTSRLDPYANAMLGGELIRDHYSALRQAGITDITDADVYSVHFTGNTALARAVRSNPNEPIQDFIYRTFRSRKVAAEAIAKNPMLQRGTVGSVYSILARKVKVDPSKLLSKAAGVDVNGLPQTSHGNDIVPPGGTPEAAKTFNLLDMVSSMTQEAQNYVTERFFGGGSAGNDVSPPSIGGKLPSMVETKEELARKKAVASTESYVPPPVASSTTNINQPISSINSMNQVSGTPVDSYMDKMVERIFASVCYTFKNDFILYPLETNVTHAVNL
jgi:hypothetical protein